MRWKCGAENPIYLFMYYGLSPVSSVFLSSLSLSPCMFVSLPCSIPTYRYLPAPLPLFSAQYFGMNATWPNTPTRWDGSFFLELQPTTSDAKYLSCNKIHSYSNSIHAHMMKTSVVRQIIHEGIHTKPRI